jgi:hypothetical protein
MIGMRWIIWGDTNEVPPEIFEEMMAFVARALGITDATVSTSLLETKSTTPMTGRRKSR